MGSRWCETELEGLEAPRSMPSLSGGPGVPSWSSSLGASRALGWTLRSSIPSFLSWVASACSDLKPDFSSWPEAEVGLQH